MQKPIPEKSDSMTGDVILQLPLEELHAFHDHPYKVLDDACIMTFDSVRLWQLPK